MMMPEVSVLIPCYNAGRFLGAALDSVFAQSFTDYEVIVVDDGSEDNTAEVIARYPQVTYVRCPHRGISAARNQALALSKGTWIAFLDADDLWLPEKLEKQMAYLADHPDCQILFSKRQNFLDESQSRPTPMQQRLLQTEDIRCIPSALIRRTLFETFGSYREDCRIGEDTDWLIRLTHAGIDLTCMIPEVLYLRRIHDKNISLTSQNKDEALQTIIRSIRRTRNQPNG